MSCLFCDQTPETCNAREKLAAVAKLLNCSLVNIIMSIQSLLTENAYNKMHIESLLQDRDKWREEANRAPRYFRYREPPASYMGVSKFGRERWGEVFGGPGLTSDDPKTGEGSTQQ